MLNDEDLVLRVLRVLDLTFRSSLLITNQNTLTKTHTYSKLSFQRNEPLVHIILQEGFLDSDLLKIQWASRAHLELVFGS
jgi:hypothetical protein